MARWRLLQPHYINLVQKMEWEQKETDQFTGREVRKRYTVPAYLDPKDEAAWSGPKSGEIIVCQGKGERYDYEFLGEPTPDMLPLDDEATAISESFKHKWKHPIEGMETTYSERILLDLQEQVASIQSKTTGTGVIQNVGVPAEAFTELQEQMKQMMANQNALLQKLLEAPPARRI